jgi:hypothetical protein
MGNYFYTHLAGFRRTQTQTSSDMRDEGEEKERRTNWTERNDGKGPEERKWRKGRDMTANNKK